MKHSIATGILAALVTITTITSCGVGKKPTRKNVSIETDSIKQRYGANTVVDSSVIVSATPSEPNVATPGISDAQKQALVSTLLPLWAKDIQYTTFSGKAKMHYATNGQKQEFVANIRISKDKIIWVNITALGGMVNAARAYVTPDSIFLVNYLQKEVHKLPVSEAQKLLPAAVDFSALQNLIIGNVLTHKGTPTNATDFGGTWSLEVTDGSMVQQLGYNKADSTLRSLQVRTQDESMQGMIQYGSYETVNDRQFSTGRVITISSKGEAHYIDMNFNKAEFDIPLEFPFSIPQNYTQK